MKKSCQFELNTYDLVVIEHLLPALCEKHGLEMTTECMRTNYTRKNMHFPSTWKGTIHHERVADSNAPSLEFELRPWGKDEHHSSDSSHVLSFSFDSLENGNKSAFGILFQELKTALDDELPNRFFNMEHFVSCLTIPMKTQLTSLAQNMIPNALAAVEETLEGFVKRESVHYEHPDSHEVQFGYRRVELRENHFSYVPYNEFTIFQNGAIMVAVGITLTGGVLEEEQTFLTAWFSVEHKEEINPLFGESFEQALLKGLEIKGGKFTGDQRILRMKEHPAMDDIKLEPAVREKVEKEILSFFDMEPWYRKAGLPFKRGVALYGPPGTGKTMLARILAGTRKETVIWVRAGDISTVKDMDRVFRLARMGAPSIIILEDVDFYLRDREQMKGDNFSVATMLSQLDGLEENDGLLVIVSTNRIELVEKAIIERPGRIDAKIFFGELGPALIAELLEEKLKSFPRDFDTWHTLFSADRHLMTGAQAVELASMILRYSIHAGFIETSSMHPDAPQSSITITREAVKKALKDIRRAQNAATVKGFGGADF